MGLRRRVCSSFAALVLAGFLPATTHAGDGLSRLFNRKAASPINADEKPGPVASTMNWRSIPRPARDAAKKLAATKDASVTRCVAIEGDDMISYEIHASHHLGPFKKDDFVLASVSEPATAAEARRKEQTLSYRLRHLGRARRKGLSANPDPASGTVYGKVN